MSANRAVTALLIDDDPQSHHANQQRLEMDGYAVVVVRDQNEGLARARQIAPNAIFIHLMSGRAGSLPLMQALRSDDSCRHIRVVVLGDQPQGRVASKQLRAVPRDGW